MVRAKFLDNAVDGKNRVERNGVVISFQRHARCGQRTDDRNRSLAGFKRQCMPFILEQDHGFTRGAQSQFGVFRRIDFVERNGREGHLVRRIEHPETHARSEQALDYRIELGLGEKLPTHRLGEGFVGSTAVQVGAAINARCRAFGVVRRVVMPVRLREVVDRIAIGGHVSIEAPVAAQYVAQQHFAGARGNLVDGVVRAHDRVGMALGNRRPKRGQVRIPEVVRGWIDVGLMAGAFWPAMHRVVLGRGHRA